MTVTRVLFVVFLGIENYMLPCFTKKIFGIDCPGCGIQRSLLFLAKGDFMAAFEMYPAIYPILALLGFMIYDSFVSVAHGQKIINGLLVIVVAFIVISYILKFI